MSGLVRIESDIVLKQFELNSLISLSSEMY